MSAPVVHAEILIQPLPSGFTPEGFDCGKLDMNDYLSDGSADGDRAANFSHTYVAHFDGRFIGYISVLTDAIRLDRKERPNGIAYPTAPAVKVGRVAVCKSVQFQGVGEYLIQYVVGKVRNDVSSGFGCRYLTLDSHTDKVEWYEKRGFVRNEEQTFGQKAYRYFKTFQKKDMAVPLDTVSMRYDLFMADDQASV